MADNRKSTPSREIKHTRCIQVEQVESLHLAIRLQIEAQVRVPGLQTPLLSPQSASEAAALWRYRSFFIIIIIINANVPNAFR